MFWKKKSRNTKGSKRCQNLISHTKDRRGIYALCKRRHGSGLGSHSGTRRRLYLCGHLAGLLEQYGQIDGWSTEPYPEVHIEPYRGGVKFKAIRGELKITVLRHIFDESSPSIYIFREGTQLSFSQDEIRASAVGNELTNPNIVKKWLKTCQEKHGSSCWPTTKLKNMDDQNFRLIDLHEFCLVRGKPHQEYFAFSYVGGTPTQRQLLLRTSLNANSLGRWKSYVFQQRYLSHNPSQKPWLPVLMGGCPLYRSR
jgi:hypothetical protein